jgi:hypothetical protein
MLLLDLINSYLIYYYTYAYSYLNPLYNLLSPAYISLSNLYSISLNYSTKFCLLNIIYSIKLLNYSPSPINPLTTKLSSFIQLNLSFSSSTPSCITYLISLSTSLTNFSVHLLMTILSSTLLNLESKYSLSF